MGIRINIWALLLLLPAVGMAAGAVTIQPLSSIQEAAKQFLEEEAAMMQGEPEVSIGRIDPRLRLAQCDQPLAGFWPNGARKMGNVTVGVRCQGSVNWSVYVRARVALYDTVVVSSRPLSRGSRLGVDDVELMREDITRLGSGYFTTLEQVVGMEARHGVRAGMVLNRNLLKAPIVIRRGDKVSITASTGSVRVQMEGKALEAGAVGELIEVENLSSKQRLEAEVIGPGVVQVRM